MIVDFCNNNFTTVLHNINLGLYAAPK